MDKIFENNTVEVAGEVVTEPEYSHESFGERFYIFNISVKRLSGMLDTIPVTISERAINISEIRVGKRFKIYGQFRSFNKHMEHEHRLILSVFARDIMELDDNQLDVNENYITLDGYICKEPIYRKTPLGREIADLLLAVNRPYGKSDYIPCICWGRNARYANNFHVGTRCEIWGRIQSREYMKKLSEDQVEKRVAYEVSVSKLELLDNLMEDPLHA